MHPKAKAQQIIDLAQGHVEKASMRDSAQLCIDDARACFARGLYEYAIGRAVKSLAYSIGVFSPLYQAASAFDKTGLNRV
jgi:hypothetical protein